MSKIYTLLVIGVFSMLSCKSKQNLVDTEVKESTTLIPLKLPSTLTKEIIEAGISLAHTTEIISTLASDEFEGRESGKASFDLCVDYVANSLKEYGIKPLFNNNYRDSFKLKGVSSYNVLGVIGDYDKTKEHIIIGAHLDHIGTKESGEDRVYNGANDNASGVTAVMQISKILSQYQFDQNIIVALFGAEEKGLLGSKHLSKKMAKEGYNLSTVFNFEMIGKILTTGPNKVYLTGYNKSDCAEIMNELHGSLFVEFLPAEISYQLFSRSDNFPFYAEFKIPSHSLSTFDFQNYAYYHKLGDEIEELDLENMNEIIKSSTLIIAKFLTEYRQISMKTKK